MDRQQRRMLRGFYRPWYRRPFVWFLFLLPLVIGARIAFGPWLADETRARLAQTAGQQTTFSDLDVFTFPPVLVYRDVAVSRGGATIAQAARVEIHAQWKGLFDPARRVVSVRVVRPVLTPRPDAQIDLEALVAALPAAKIDVLALDGASVRTGEPAGVAPFVDRLDLRMRGLATRAALAPQEPVTVEGHGEVFGSGRLTVSLTTNAWAPAMDAAGSVQVTGLALPMLELVAQGGAARPLGGSGAIDVAANVAVKQGAISGKVQPGGTSLRAGLAPTALARGLEMGLGRVGPGVKVHVAQLSPPTEEEPALVPPTPIVGTVPPEDGRVDALLGLTRAVVLQGIDLRLLFLDANAGPDVVAAQ